jgi:serine phosphatase RsbU (regulator of sigma subunit)
MAQAGHRLRHPPFPRPLRSSSRLDGQAAGVAEAIAGDSTSSPEDGYIQVFTEAPAGFPEVGVGARGPVKTIEGVAPGAVPSARAGWPLLLVEDDDADALLVEEMLIDVAAPVSLRRARTIGEALAIAPHSRCVLLDLGLPDSQGLSALRALLAVAPRAAVIVLTGLVDEHRGDEAVAAGAQDYLVKGQVDGRSLIRAVRYALERKRWDEAALALQESALRAEENARLERGLLPTPLLRDTAVIHRTSCRPGRAQTLLGGDFYDLVEAPDGGLHVVLGDVCGHGPDEAAIGVSLRIAWRTLVLAGVPEPERLAALQDVLVSERASDELFATVCTLVVAPDRRTLRMRLAGHPAPAVIRPALEQLDDSRVGPALGVLESVDCPSVDVPLPDGWALLLATDGLLEGRDGPDGERIGWPGVFTELDAVLREAAAGTGTTAGSALLTSLPDLLIDRVEARNGGPLTDDVALLVLGCEPPG